MTGKKVKSHSKRVSPDIVFKVRSFEKNPETESLS